MTTEWKQIPLPYSEPQTLHPRMKTPPPSPSSELNNQPLYSQTLNNLEQPLFPLSIGDLTQTLTPLMEWQTYQPMYYQTLLRLHPDHPHPVKPDELDSRILQYPLGQAILIIRQIILELKAVEKFPDPSTLPPWLRPITPAIQPLLSLDHWSCILIIWMPILAPYLPNIIWNQMHQLLESILNVLRTPLQSNTGSSTPPMQNKLIPFDINYKIVNRIRDFKGEVWILNKDIRIELPMEAWNNFGQGKYNMAEYHDFQELAWLQTCQFNIKDLQEALYQTQFFNDFRNQQESVMQHRTIHNYKYNYIDLVYTTRVYQILHQWIENDKWYGAQPLYPTNIPEEYDITQLLSRVNPLPFLDKYANGNQAFYQETPDSPYSSERGSYESDMSKEQE